MHVKEQGGRGRGGGGEGAEGEGEEGTGWGVLALGSIFPKSSSLYLYWEGM